MPRWQQGALALGFLVFLAGTSLLVYLDIHFSRLIDARLGGEVFNNASIVFSAPTPVFVGEVASPDEIAARLRKALYVEGDRNSGTGAYQRRGDRLEVHPGPGSFFENPQLHEPPAVL